MKVSVLPIRPEGWLPTSPPLLSHRSVPPSMGVCGLEKYSNRTKGKKKLQFISFFSYIKFGLIKGEENSIFCEGVLQKNMPLIKCIFFVE